LLVSIWGSYRSKIERAHHSIGEELEAAADSICEATQSNNADADAPVHQD